MPESKISESEILETEISKETQESKLKQKAVSYTHLDVYKRQNLGSPCPICISFLC